MIGRFVLMLALLGVTTAHAAEPCRIRILDKSNGWPVPLVELRTVSEVRFISDNAGVIAFDLPECMGRETWFHVIGHGYERPKDGFGYRGVRLTPQPGATLTVEVTRTVPAKRIGRLTGSGLFAESQKLGDAKDWHDSEIVGCDSVQTSRFQGKRFWLWGDTNVARYPLGIFNVLAATTSPKPWDRYEPPLRPQFDYFRTEKLQPIGVANWPGPGPTWIFGLTTLPDAKGAEHLVGTAMKVPKYLDASEYRLCEWDAKAQQFVMMKSLWKKSDGQERPSLPEGNAVTEIDATGQEWRLFGNPFPHLKCPATYEAWQDSRTWQTLVPPKSLASQGEPVIPHSGAIGWHAWRKKWVAIFTQKFGKPSAFGEVWYAESSSPYGPWERLTKVLTHENYTFYNPRLHLDLSPSDSAMLLFEGTYTAEFAKNPPPTPRYNYNQMLYRLDLDAEPFTKPSGDSLR